MVQTRRLVADESTAETRKRSTGFHPQLQSYPQMTQIDTDTDLNVLLFHLCASVLSVDQSGEPGTIITQPYVSASCRMNFCTRLPMMSPTYRLPCESWATPWTQLHSPGCSWPSPPLGTVQSARALPLVLKRMKIWSLGGPPS